MIDKNIPIPKQLAPKGRWSTIAENMCIGDSYLDELGFESSPKGSKAFNSFLQYGRRNGMKFIARKVEGGIRIWRVA